MEERTIFSILKAKFCIRNNILIFRIWLYKLELLHLLSNKT